ncbi:MAG: hypothetical protein ACEPOW_04215 [Bacteroidales bacterium]
MKKAFWIIIGYTGLVFISTIILVFSFIFYDFNEQEVVKTKVLKELLQDDFRVVYLENGQILIQPAKERMIAEVEYKKGEEIPELISKRKEDTLFIKLQGSGDALKTKVKISLLFNDSINIVAKNNVLRLNDIKAAKCHIKGKKSTINFFTSCKLKHIDVFAQDSRIRCQIYGLERVNSTLDSSTLRLTYPIAYLQGNIKNHSYFSGRSERFNFQKDTSSQIFIRN